MPGAISKEEFLKCAAEGDVEGVRRALVAGMAPNAHDEQHSTALHRAALAKHAAIVELLLNHGAELGVPNKHCRSVLSQVLGMEDARLVSLLFKQANKELAEAVEAFTKWDRSTHNQGPATASSKMLDAVEEELRATTALLENALSEVAAKGNMVLVQRLLEYGFGVHTVPEAGRKTIRYAIDTGHLALVRLLLEQGVDARTDGWPLLAQAARKRDPAVVTCLLDHGATIPATAEVRQAALLTAAEEGSLALVHLLLIGGADVHAVDRTGQTALHKAAGGTAASSATPEEYRATVELLLAFGADAHATDKDGKTALDLARVRGRTVMVELLQTHHTPQVATHERSETPFQRGSLRSAVTVVELLLKSIKRFRPR